MTSTAKNDMSTLSTSSLNRPINDLDSIENGNGLRNEYLSKLSDSCRNMGKYGNFEVHWMIGYVVLIVFAIAAYVSLYR